MLEVAVVKAILINGTRKMPLDLGNIGPRYSRYTGRCWAREYLSSMAQDTLLKIGSSNFSGLVQWGVSATLGKPAPASGD